MKKNARKSLGKFGYNSAPKLRAPHIPVKKYQDIPVYRPTRGTFVHDLPRNEFLYNPAVKYPIYNRLPHFWREEYEYKRPLLHQVVQEASKRPQHEGLWTRENGKFVKVHNYPVRVLFPPHSEEQIWAGEGVILGFKPGRGDINNPVKFPRTWKPYLRKMTMYSEVLDRHITTKFTTRALDLIDEAFGFDNFILQTHSKILQKFGSTLKREMLLKLARSETDLYPNNPQKRERIFEKYKNFIIPEDQAEWTGLTLVEAMKKQWEKEKAAGFYTPLLDIYTQELKAKLTNEVDQTSEESIQVFDMTPKKGNTDQTEH